MRPLVVGLVAMMLSACAARPVAGAPPGSHRLHIVAAENFWGSLVSQLAGPGAQVTSIERDPNADPHQYEANASTARAFADADYVIVNGVGYDTWADKMLAANPRPDRRVIDIGALVGKKEGDNPHLWYNPSFVTAAADRMTLDLKALDPSRADAYDAARGRLDQAFAPFRARVAQIKAAHPGAPVGATESIFVYMAQALGLDLTTPPELMTAVAEGNDPPASAVTTFDDQIRRRRIDVLVYNQQTSTAVTANLRMLADRAGIPTVAITETVPAAMSFEAWQTAELDALSRALGTR